MEQSSVSPYHKMRGRMDGTPALDLWDLATGVLHSSVRGNSSHSNDFAQGNFRHETCEKQSKCRTKQKRLVSKRICLEEIDYVPPNVHQSRPNRFFVHLLRTKKQC